MRLVTVLALILAGLSGAPAVADTGTARVCLHLPITGQAPLDRHPSRFAQVYFDAVNAELGGVDGRPVEMLTYDDRYNPPFAVQAAERCKTGGADLYVGTSGRDEVRAVAAWAQREGVPYLHSSSGHELTAYTTSGFVGPTDEEQSRALADVLSRNGARLTAGSEPIFGMIRHNSPALTAAHDAFVVRMRELGHQVVVDEAVATDENDFRGTLARMRASGVNLINNLTPALIWIRLMAQADEMNFHPALASIGSEASFGAVARTASQSMMRAVVLHDPAPAYTEDPTSPYAAEVAEFRRIYETYANDEPNAPLDDVDWTFYLRARQVHRFLDAADGDLSSAHLLGLMSSYTEEREASFPSCALDFTAGHRIGSRRWHVLQTWDDDWRQAGTCVGETDAVDLADPPPFPDRVPPAIDCGGPVQVAGTIRCSLHDDGSGVGEYRVVDDGVLGSRATPGTGSCLPGVSVDVELLPGPRAVLVEASDCAGNPATARHIVVSLP